MNKNIEIDNNSRLISKDSPNLDLLRTVAVLFVLIDHTVEFMGYKTVGFIQMHQLGILGVLFFFVHTSLVLMLSLQRQNDSLHGWPLAVSFYIRRFFRLYPLAVLFLIAMIIFKIPSTHLEPHLITYEPAGAWKITANLLLIQNLTHHYRGSIIGQYWSLPLEVQMYALLPFLYFAVGKIKKNWVLMSLWLIVILSFAHLQGTRLHIQIMEYIPNFMGGVIAYTLSSQFKRKVPANFWAPFLMIVSLTYLINPVRIMGWLICFILGAGIPFFQEINTRWLKSIAKTTAKYSYGIYLSHFFSIWFAFTHLNNASPALQWAVFLSLLFLLPYALYHLIEKPGIAFGVKFAAIIEKPDALPATRQFTEEPAQLVLNISD